MTGPAETPIDDIKESDIVFDCRFCGKSLAIDYRGAGLTIPCSDCGRDVEVPIPEGMELTDIDSTVEEQELRILNLRRSLAASESKAKTLEAEVDSLRPDHTALEAIKREGGARSMDLSAKLQGVQHSLEECARRLGEINSQLSESRSPEAAAEE